MFLPTCLVFYFCLPASLFGLATAFILLTFQHQ
jgi:hypothetical protein